MNVSMLFADRLRLSLVPILRMVSISFLLVVVLPNKAQVSVLCLHISFTRGFLLYKITLFVIFSIASINSLVLILFLILLMCPFPSKIKYVIHFYFFRKALSSHKMAYHIIQLYSNGDKKENHVATVGKVKLLICILYP